MILWRSNISIRIIFWLEIWCLKITISRGIHVGYTTQRASQIHLRCSQADVFFIDHVSGYARIMHQVSINDTETIKAKLTFEKESQSQLDAIKGYHTNNGIFNASEFMKELLKKQKKIRFSGAGASHQNGAAERSIKTIVTMERTMLMHAALRCPDEILYTAIWPMTMDYAVWVYNCIPDIQSGFSAIEIW